MVEKEISEEETVKAQKSMEDACEVVGAIKDREWEEWRRTNRK